MAETGKVELLLKRLGNMMIYPVKEDLWIMTDLRIDELLAMTDEELEKEFDRIHEEKYSFNIVG